jgi:hypothetical protein
MSGERILFTVAVALFLGLATFQLTLPGLHYDEAFEAVPAMQILFHQPTTTFRGNGILVGGQLLPFMTQDYIGAINTYLAIPFFLLLGVNMLGLRAMALAVGLVTLWLVFRLGKALYGPTAAILAALLLSVNPTFVFWSRQGVFVTSVTAAIGLGTVLSWLHWWRTGARRYAVIGAFLTGLGLYAKFLFLWLVVALGIAVMVLNFRRWKDLHRRLSTGPVGWSIAAFLLGVAPLIFYNVQTGGTLASLRGNLTTSYYGTNNLAFLHNLMERLGQFAAVLTGSHFWYLGRAYANWLNLGLFLAAFGLAVGLTARSISDEARLVFFPFLVIAGIVLASCATVSALWVTHFALMAPWPPLAIAAAASRVIHRGGYRVLGKRVGLAIILTLAIMGVSWVADIVTDVRYHRALRVSGGLGAHSDAIEDLSGWLTEDVRGRSPVAAMDWGIAASVTFLTRGVAVPVEAFGYDWETDAEFAHRLESFIHNPSSIYLWRAPDEIIFDRSDDFKQLYEPLGLEEDILQAFYERSGRPVLGATRLVPEGTAINPPQP